LAVASAFGAFGWAAMNCSTGVGSFRYRIVPVAGEEILSADDAKAKGPNYLVEEMPARA
jgi:hypothetical protein